MSASDYARLESVIFAGGQYFTLYNLPQDCSVRIVSSVANTDSGIKTVFGYRASSSASSDISIEYQSSTLKNWSRNSGYITPGEQTIVADRQFTAEATLLTARSIMYVGKYGTSNNYQYFLGNLYSLTITAAGGTPLHELLPRRRLSDDAVGFYDTVADVFYENEGSGDFLPVEPAPALDKKLFLAGIAVGRQLKGWATLHRALPTRIEVLTPPTLRDYADGAALDFTGLEVVLRKADGGRYTDANYPDGLIPMSELSFPVTHAHFDGTGGQGAGEFYVGDTLACRSLYCEERDMSYADYQADNKHSPLAKLFRDSYGFGEWFFFWDHVPFKVAYISDGNRFIAAAAPGDDLDSFRGETNTVGWGSPSSHVSYAVTPKFTYEGKEVLYWDVSYYHSLLYESYLEPSEIVDLGAAAWAMVYGDLGEKQSVPVEWTAPLTKFPALPTMRDAVSVFVHENEE